MYLTASSVSDRYTPDIEHTTPSSRIETSKKTLPRLKGFKLNKKLIRFNLCANPAVDG